MIQRLVCVYCCLSKLFLSWTGWGGVGGTMKAAFLPINMFPGLNEYLNPGGYCHVKGTVHPKTEISPIRSSLFCQFNESYTLKRKETTEEKQSRTLTLNISFH